MIRSFTILLFVLVSSGCSGERAAYPERTVDAYVEAVEAGDAPAVYALLDEEGRRGMDPESFARYFSEHRDSIVRQAQALRASIDGGGELEVSARVPTAPGDAGVLAWRDGAWWVAQMHPENAAQDAPIQTVEAFRSAVEARNLEALLALLSNERRAGYMAELEALGAALAQGEGKMVAAGDAAVYVLPGGDQIHLVREDGVWRIHRVEQSPR